MCIYVHKYIYICVFFDILCVFINIIYIYILNMQKIYVYKHDISYTCI